MLARTAEPFAECAEEIAETVRNSPAIASDETSARVKGKTHWQWTFIGATAVAHPIAPTRGKIVPKEFLNGAKPKVWISDRLPAQCNHADAHQLTSSLSRPHPVILAFIKAATAVETTPIVIGGASPSRMVSAAKYTLCP